MSTVVKMSGVDLLQRNRESLGYLIVMEDMLSPSLASSLVRLDRSTLHRPSGCCWQGHAVKAGMLIARGANLLFMDADGATKVSDVEKLERSLAESIGEHCFRRLFIN